jgi:hypothetical protein
VSIQRPTRARKTEQSWPRARTRSLEPTGLFSMKNVVWILRFACSAGMTLTNSSLRTVISATSYWASGTSRSVVSTRVVDRRPLTKPSSTSPRRRMSGSAYDHPARRVALCPFHAQLSRCRRSARRARSRCLIRDGAAVGFEVRAAVRPRTSPQTPAANLAVASRRDDRMIAGRQF